MLDYVVIGAGPCGVTSAIYLKRFNRNGVVIYKDSGSLNANFEISNLYSYDKINAYDLFQKGLKQLDDLNIDKINEEVLSIEYENEGFNVITNYHNFSTKTVILATGFPKNILNIKGIKELEGNGISYCAICDGFLYRNRHLGLVGSGEFMLHELEVLKNFTKDITVFSNGDVINLAGDVEAELIKSFSKENDQIKVQLETKKIYVDQVFIANKTKSGFNFAKELGLLMSNNLIDVDKNYMTNINGIFAGGDAISGLRQVAKAASDGAHIGMSINEYLKGGK